MTRKKRMLAVVVSVLCICMTAAGKTYLVSVGVSDYPGSSNDLVLPARDANTIAWIYSRNTDVEYALLLNDKATCTNIKKSMNALFSKAGANDIVVLFFSGHGDKGCFYAYDGPLYYSSIRKAMAGSRSKHKMIFADACFSGKIRTSKTGGSSATKKADVMLFLSSRSNEKSIENPGMKNGFFTTYLEKGLRGGADANGDRTVTARELYDYVHKGVISLSGGLQHPVMWGNFPSDMPVIKW